MILCDAGPLIAAIDRDDQHHQACRAAMDAMMPPLITTWPCLAEAMYLVGRAGGFAAQEVLWSYLGDEIVFVRPPVEAEWQRMRELMAQYADVPMDLGDASMVTSAEVLGLRRIFTFDQHYHVYRIHNANHFEVVP
jgi:predicted nucleic acid-binding protein